MAEQIVKTKKNCESFFNDDFSTPQAMAELFEVIRLYNHLIPSSTQNTEDSRAVSRLFIDFVMDFGKPMALFQENPLVFLKNLDDKLLEQKNCIALKWSLWFRPAGKPENKKTTRSQTG